VTETAHADLPAAEVDQLAQLYGPEIDQLALLWAGEPDQKVATALQIMRWELRDDAGDELDHFFECVLRRRAQIGQRGVSALAQ
jgi:hypothetical protein